MKLTIADVNDYVKHCAFDATHQLALGIGHTLIVKTTHYTVG